MPTKEVSERWWGIGRASILALGAGAAAGVCAAVWTSQSLNNYATALLAGNHLPQISTQKPSPIPGTYEEALLRVREGARTGVVAIVPASVDSDAPKTWIHDASVLGYGAIVSDDGWVVVDASVLEGMKNPLEDIEVWANAKRYSITAVVQDSYTSAVMLRTNAMNLTPIGFAPTDAVDSGEMMFVVDALGGVYPTAVRNSDAEVVTGSHEAEVFGTEWIVADTLADVSMPVLNAAGEFAGLARGGSDRVLPLHHTLATLRSIVKSGSARAPFFGAYVVDLAYAYNLGSVLTHDLRAGALLLPPDASTHVTVRGGPAAEAGFASKDILLAVDGESITESTSLAEILSSYAPGSVARCTVLRGEQTLTIAVTLGDATELVYSK